ncbi:class 3-domain-containing protein [Pelagophyceae sp. CCMP2097]|nr:class 3-domain-containing protein [Pelagophyceae sp. CCMP2097]
MRAASGPESPSQREMSNLDHAHAAHDHAHVSPRSPRIPNADAHDTDDDDEELHAPAPRKRCLWRLRVCAFAGRRSARGAPRLPLTSAAFRILLEALSPSGTRIILMLLYVSCGLSIWWRMAGPQRVDVRRSKLAKVGRVTNTSVAWSAVVRGLDGYGCGTVSVSTEFGNGSLSTWRNVTGGDDDEKEPAVTFSIDIGASKHRARRTWSHVLSRRNRETTMTTMTPMTSDRRSSDDARDQGDDDPGAISAHLASWYQNMEALSERSRIHALKLRVTYCTRLHDDEDGDCVVVSQEVRDALVALPQRFVVSYWSHKYLSSPYAKACRIFFVLLWFCLALAFAPHARALDAQDGTRQRLILLLVALLLYIDPIETFAALTPDSASVPPWVAYASFVSRRLAQSLFLGVLLLMADGDGAAAKRAAEASFKARRLLRRGAAPLYEGLLAARSPLGGGAVAVRRGSEYCREHWWLVVVVMYLLCAIFALSLRFPSLFGSDRPPTLSLDSWPNSILHTYVALSLGMVAAELSFGVLLIWLLCRAGARLDAAPYLATRRYQLSYRLFMLQSTLVAGVSLAAYVGLVLSLCRKYGRSLTVLFSKAAYQGQESKSYDAALRDLAGALEAFVSDDVHELSTAFFLCVYVALLVYLHLPPPTATAGFHSRHTDAALAYVRAYLPRAASTMRDEIGRLANLDEALVGARFVLTEKQDRRRRRRALRPSRQHEERLVHVADFFVVETARMLAHASESAYFDAGQQPRETKTVPDAISDETKVDVPDGAESGPPPAESGRPAADSEGVLAEVRCESTGTYCAISKHATEPWLILAFRGSASVRHWSTNIDIFQSRLSLHDDYPVEAYRDEINGNAPQQDDGCCLSGAENGSSQARAAAAERGAEEDPAARTPVACTRQPAADAQAAAAADAPARETLRESREGEESDVDAPPKPGCGGASRAFVDATFRIAALLFGSVSRGVEAVGVTAEAVGRASQIADVLPGVEKLLMPCVHRGFWTAYCSVRAELHVTVLQLLVAGSYDRVIVTGHSLGGALATLAAADLAAHTLPRARAECALRDARSAPREKGKPAHARLRLTVVSFGSPRVGNHIWTRIYDALVPDSWRVVCDGDVVTGTKFTLESGMHKGRDSLRLRRSRCRHAEVLLQALRDPSRRRLQGRRRERLPHRAFLRRGGCSSCHVCHVWRGI